MAGTVQDITDRDEGGTPINGEFRINATAYYPFNGNANDESINSNNLTTNGTPVLTTDHLGNANNAYEVSNTSPDYFSRAYTLASGTKFTFAIWVRPKNDYISETSRWFQFLRANGSAGTALEFGWQGYSDCVDFKIFETDNSSTSAKEADNTSWLSSEWRQYVGIYDGSSIHLYKNGNLVTSSIISNPTRDWTNFFINANTNSFAGDYVISEVILLSGIALSADEVLNLYNVTSVHKLDKPLVTKTDIDGNSITGYESFAPIQSSGTSLSGTYLQLDSNVDVDKNNHCFYFEIKTNVQAFQRIAAHSQDATHGRIDMNTIGSNNYFTIESLTNNSWQVVVNVSTDLNDDKIHKILIEFNSDATRIYVDGNLEGTASANNDSSSSIFRYRTFLSGEQTVFDYGSGFNGVFSKPIIFNRILTADERAYLFGAGEIQYPIGPFSVLDNPLYAYLNDCILGDRDEDQYSYETLTTITL